MPASLALPLPPRPFLKWAGGKSQLLAQYENVFPKRYSTYYEPFLGGGAVFFHLRPHQAVLLDINAELVNVYQCVRDRVEAVIALLQEHRDRHSSDYYYHVRSQMPDCPVARAARLIYLNKTCFNGLYRENAKGQFNVPIGRYKNPTIADVGALRGAAIALRTARIEEQPFDVVLHMAHGSQDFVYFDPPYHPISATSKFTAYNRYSFHDADQVRLRDTFAILADRGVSVMLSNSDCPFIRDLYKDFHIHTIWATRAINANAQKRGKITEVLVTNY
jgi:DNA adenine methylase